MEKELAKSRALNFKKSSSSEKKDIKVWSICSGKGGVGKTFTTASLGITLTRMGHSVTIIDLDLGGANIHTALGCLPSHMNMRHFFEGAKNLSELTIPTAIPRLSFIQGFWDSWMPTEFTQEQLSSLLPALRTLKSDYVLLDLGAGALDCHLQIFKASDEKILITSPEPTSIEKTYRFIEAHLCHSIKANSTSESFGEMIQTLRSHRQRTLAKPFSFRSYLKEQTGFTFNFFENFSQTPLRLIVNGTRSGQEIELGHSMKSVCKKYYDLSIDYLSPIAYDNAVWQSVKACEPVLIAQPFTPLSGQFSNICKQLIEKDELRAVV